MLVCDWLEANLANLTLQFFSLYISCPHIGLLQPVYNIIDCSEQATLRTAYKLKYCKVRLARCVQRPGLLPVSVPSHLMPTNVPKSARLQQSVSTRTHGKPEWEIRHSNTSETQPKTNLFGHFPTHTDLILLATHSCT